MNREKGFYLGKYFIHEHGYINDSTGSKTYHYWNKWTCRTCGAVVIEGIEDKDQYPILSEHMNRQHHGIMPNCSFAKSYYAVIAEEYDSGNPDELMLLTHDKNAAKEFAEYLTDEWNQREDVSNYEYSFIVLEIPAMDFKPFDNTYQLVPYYDGKTKIKINEPPKKDNE